jgi:GT2 family glycosyltransferase
VFSVSETSSSDKISTGCAMEAENDIAVLLTCHDRAEKTLLSLHHLFAQRAYSGRLTVYLVDDGSSDGTADLVRAEFPTVKIIAGTGDLYWGGGMALAFTTALRERHAFYLWLNDDTYLFEDALATLLGTYRSLREGIGTECIVVGAMREPDKEGLTSSGLIRSVMRPLRFERMPPRDRPQRCMTFQGNCVLIPRTIAEDVGPVDETFRHYIGDIDYGLRVARAGYQNWLAPGVLGTCRSDPRPPSVGRGPKALAKAIAQLREPKGVSVAGATLYSFREWSRFAARHGGPFWIVHFLFPYRRLLRCLMP